MTWFQPCPNRPPCPHWGLAHDIEEPGDPFPTCCTDGCGCGHKQGPMPAGVLPSWATLEERLMADERVKVDLRVQVKRNVARAVVDLGQLVLRFGRVNRITYHEDGMTPESDTDHTVALGLIACAFAAGYVPGLNAGTVAQFALVHDLVEVYAGDTPTLRMPTRMSKQEKAAREALAMLQIRAEFLRELPWVVDWLEAYERQQMPEARYVRAMDKMLPKITHILNNLATVREQGMTKAELIARYDHQEDELREYASDFPQLFELRAELMAMVMARAGVLDA